jgi:hypothetical protein
MRRLFQWGLWGIVSVVVGACNSTTDESASKQPAKKNANETEAEHGHSHTGGDELVWPKKDLEHAGYTLNLGHHGIRVLAGHDVEPAVSIQRDGTDVADAKVFISLISVEDEQVIAEEVSTIYEPKTDSEPAHYAQGKLSVPEGPGRVIIRYRITFPQAGSEETFNVEVTVD